MSPSGCAPTVSGPAAASCAHGPETSPHAPRRHTAPVSPQGYRLGFAPAAATSHSSSVGRRPPRARQKALATSRDSPEAARARSPEVIAVASGREHPGHATSAIWASKASISKDATCTVRGRTRPSASQSEGPTSTVVSGTRTRARGATHEAPDPARTSGGGHTLASPHGPSGETQHLTPRRKKPAPHAISSVGRRTTWETSANTTPTRPTLAATTPARLTRAFRRAPRALRSPRSPPRDGRRPRAGRPPPGSP